MAAHIQNTFVIETIQFVALFLNVTLAILTFLRWENQIQWRNILSVLHFCHESRSSKFVGISSKVFQN